MKILVVDDEDAVRDLVKDAMSEQGYEVLTAASGTDALGLGPRLSSIWFFVT